jgi:hypothetical protein
LQVAELNKELKIYCGKRHTFCSYAKLKKKIVSVNGTGRTEITSLCPYVNELSHAVLPF